MELRYQKSGKMKITSGASGAKYIHVLSMNWKQLAPTDVILPENIFKLLLELVLGQSEGAFE